VNEKQRYLDAETAAGAELKKWTDGEGDGPMCDTIGLVKYMLAEASRQGQLGLIRDLAATLNQLEKTRTQQRLSLGHLFTREQHDRFFAAFGKVIVEVLQTRMPDGEWQDAIDKVTERWHQLRMEEQQRAAGEVSPAPRKRLKSPEQYQSPENYP
jgi:hypothetical protein